MARKRVIADPAKTKVQVTVDSVTKKYDSALDAFQSWQRNVQTATVQSLKKILEGDMEFLAPPRYFLNRLVFLRTEKDTDVQGFIAYLVTFCRLTVEKVPDGTFSLSFKEEPNEAEAKLLYETAASKNWWEAKNDRLLSGPEIPKGFEGQVAKGLLAGTITEDDLQNWIDGVRERIAAKQADTKVVDWVKKYQAQQEVAVQ